MNPRIYDKAETVNGVVNTSKAKQAAYRAAKKLGMTCAEYRAHLSTITPEPVKVAPKLFYDEKPLHVIDPNDCHKTLCGKRKTLGTWVVEDGMEPTCPRCFAKQTPTITPKPVKPAKTHLERPTIRHASDGRTTFCGKRIERRVYDPERSTFDSKKEFDKCYNSKPLPIVVASGATCKTCDLRAWMETQYAKSEPTVTVPVAAPKKKRGMYPGRYAQATLNALGKAVIRFANGYRGNLDDDEYRRSMDELEQRYSTNENVKNDPELFARWFQDVRMRMEMAIHDHTTRYPNLPVSKVTLDEISPYEDPDTEFANCPDCGRIPLEDGKFVKHWNPTTPRGGDKKPCPHSGQPTVTPEPVMPDYGVTKLEARRAKFKEDVAAGRVKIIPTFEEGSIITLNVGDVDANGNEIEVSMRFKANSMPCTGDFIKPRGSKTKIVPIYFDVLDTEETK